ncbi:hypothetical protein KFE25_002297 [Diacronema lutheri]|uniref:Uncharacterized protein n=1 Tax=Diacronema lutheri TaxID=2081491 RepID=A0A8J5X752_DIALT|nr:hypothetical protein KFE25_002297 [Diacronema lutheri]
MQGGAVIVRRGLAETALHGALAEALHPIRLVVGGDDLPADVIAPGGIGALLVHTAEGELLRERAAKLCKTFRHPVVAVEVDALNDVLFALGADLLTSAITVLPCASASHLAQALAEFAATKDQHIARDAADEAARIELELARVISEGSGVHPDDARALVCAVPLGEIAGASFDRLCDLSPLVPRSTAAVHRWLTAPAPPDETSGDTLLR